MKLTAVILLSALCLLLSTLKAQNVFSSEDDLKKQANKLFEEEEYVKAYPLYSQLLSLYTKDAQYNYRFGACLLYASSDKAKAIPYLEFAAKRQKQNVDKEVFFFLGKAYHLNYRFADAVKVYGVYKGMASGKQLEKFDVIRQIEMCENGKRLLRNLSELSVIEKKEMPESEFYRSYNLSEFNSKLIIRPEDLKTSLDKKKKEENIMYLSPASKQIYFSSYGEDGKNKRDIYYVNRLPNGDLSKPIRASDVINTKYDEDYVFLHPGGKILYFCSKGHNSMGGYDIFKSEWDDASQAWGKPMNMDFAINTPDDDILFISDTDEKTAYFSSRRESAQGSLSVYKIALERKSIDASPAQSALEASADSNEIKKAADFLKSQAALEINSSETEITSVAVEETTSTETSTTTPTQSVTNTDIIAIAFDDARETQKDANELRKNADAAQNLANQKSSLAQQKSKEAEALMKSSETITNQDEKLAQIDKATALKKEADKLTKEVALADNISNQLDAQAKAKQKQADAELLFAKEFETSIKSNANEKKINELLAQKEKLDKTNDSLETAANISKQAEEKQTEASKSMAKYLDIQQDVEDLQSESKRLRSEAEKTKNDGVKQNLIQQAEEMEKEAEEKKKNADSYSAKAKELQAEADNLKNNAALTSSVMQEIQSTQQTASTASTNTVTSTSPSTEITAVAVPETTTASTGTTTTTASVEPLVIKSPYVDVFISQMQEAEKKPKELDREEALAVIYQAWTDSLDAQITSLKSLLASTKTEEHRSQIQYKISELTSSVDDKRQRASDSRNKVDNLKLQETLAGISTTTTETATVSPTQPETTATTQPESATTTASVTEENLSGEKNINAAYENKLKENEKISNAYEKQVKEQIIYEEWSAALYDESVKMKKDGKSGKAEDLDKASKAKQIIAIQSSDKATQIKAENPQLAETANLSSTTETVSATQPETTSTTTTQPETTSAVTTITQPETISSTSATETASTPTVSSATTSTTTSAPETTSTTSTTAVVPESVKNKDEYTHYVALKNESDWAKKNAERQNQQASETQKIADEQFKESERLSQQSSTTADPAERQVLLDKASELEKRSLRNQAKADSIKRVAQNSEAEANAKRTESELYLQSLDKSTYEEIASVTGYKTSTQPETTSVSTTPETTTTTQPVTTTTSSSETTSQPIATTSTTTPPETTSTTSVTATQPEAATTVSTTSSETTTQPATTSASTENTARTETTTSPSTESATQPSITSSSETSTQPITTASSSSSAEMLKYYDALFDRIEISGSSYSSSKPIPVDAPMPDGLIFKVQIGAFRNPIPQNLFKGIKPITAETTPQGMKRYTAGLFQKFSSASSAKKQVNDLGYRDAFVVAFFNGKRISMNEALTKAKESGKNIDLSDFSSSSSATSALVSTASESSINIATSTDVKNVSGLFYAIQIGVFSKPVTSTQLYNIAPLNSERTDNNLIRYTTGRFSSEQKANAAKKNIADKGISDAFVVAYYNGKRIGLQAAKSLIDSQGNEVISKEKQEYTFVPSDTTTSESSAVSLSASSNKEIIFKVQVGAYRERVPIEDANRLLTLSGKGIKIFKDDNGLLVYTVGEFSEYESANNLKKQVISEGITGAFVIAFKDGKKLSAAEALDLIGNR